MLQRPSMHQSTGHDAIESWCDVRATQGLAEAAAEIGSRAIVATAVLRVQSA